MKKVYLATEFAEKGIVTEDLQALIDRCAGEGGGQVRFEAGTYFTATLELRSGVELYLDAGAVIRGVDDCLMYHNHYWEVSGETAPGSVASDRWYDALICAYNQHDIAILGEGVIDGADCFNPTGEQEFRGPHAVLFYQCEGIEFRGFSIVRSANYAIQLLGCRDIHAAEVKIYGGQDAMRITDCRNALIENCDFRTGDDCVSGQRNEDLSFINCRFNTPGGNMFLMSCIHLRMRGCKFWGQGVYPAVFKEKKRYSNGHAAICTLHAYPDSDVLASDDWLIEDIEIENIECVLRHDASSYYLDCNFGRIVIDGIRVVNHTQPIMIKGRENDSFDLTIRNGVFIRRPDQSDDGASFLVGEGFKKLTLENLTLKGCEGDSVLALSNGGDVAIRDVNIASPLRDGQIGAANIGGLSLGNTPEKTTLSPYVVDQIDSIYVPNEKDETFRGAKPYVGWQELSK